MSGSPNSREASEGLKAIKQWMEQKMPDTKSPEERFAEEEAKKRISSRYVDPHAMDPDHQDRVDRNQIAGDQLTSGSSPEIAQKPPGPRPYPASAFTAWVREDPVQSILLAAAAGFITALLIRR
jgi:hypothetical protein